MLAEFGWTVLGVMVGGACGAFMMAVIASGRDDRTRKLELANKSLLSQVTMLQHDKDRLMGELARECLRAVEAENERDKWRTVAEEREDAFNPHWSSVLPGEAG